MIRIFVTDRRGGFDHSHLKTNVWLSGSSRKSMIQKNTKMTAVDKSGSSLANKCLVLCQTLANQGLANSTSSSRLVQASLFSLEARDNGLALDAPGKTKEKKSSPSTLGRNARRKKAFLQRKKQNHPKWILTLLRRRHIQVWYLRKHLQIWQLKIHKGKSHKTSEGPEDQTLALMCHHWKMSEEKCPTCKCTNVRYVKRLLMLNTILRLTFKMHGITATT